MKRINNLSEVLSYTHDYNQEVSESNQFLEYYKISRKKSILKQYSINDIKINQKKYKKIQKNDKKYNIEI